MKNSFILKTLIDLFFYLHIITLFLFFFILPYSVINIDKEKLTVNDLQFEHWAILILFIALFIVFILGLFYLRKVARFLLSKNYFTFNIILNLKKSGYYFLITGVGYFIVVLIIWLSKLTNGSFELKYSVSSVIPLFLLVIGLFFIIISNVLEEAKEIKEENKLTV